MARWTINLSLKRARSLARSFLCDASAATAIEYALIAGLISIAITGVVGSTMDSVVALFQSVVDALP
jgi:pilus assembly protein Flp/PilA